MCVCIIPWLGFGSPHAAFTRLLRLHYFLFCIAGVRAGLVLRRNRHTSSFPVKPFSLHIFDAGEY